MGAHEPPLRGHARPSLAGSPKRTAPCLHPSPEVAQPAEIDLLDHGPHPAPQLTVIELARPVLTEQLGSPAWPRAVPGPRASEDRRPPCLNWLAPRPPRRGPRRTLSSRHRQPLFDTLDQGVS
jgi:hypothetical protein